MAISVQTNVSSLVAQENLRVTNEFQNRTIQRLTSGFRINSSGDDAAGLAVANKFRSDIAELTQGVRNANDGLSTLQIIDGGLNNISKILDRMKTLATQSASSTFTGNRTTLNNEYQSLILEINRQAANVGLGSGDVNAGRFNSNIQVYIGGGSQASNSMVSIDLSGPSNLVNATALGLTGTSIEGSTQPVVLSSADYRSGAYLNSNSTQTYRFATTAGTTSVTVVGDSDGLTGNEIVQQLNAGLAGTGITVSLNAANGNLVVSSSNSFAVAVDAVVGTGTQIQAAITDANAIVNTGKYNFDGGTVTAVGTAAQTLTFTPLGGSAINVTLSNGDSKDVVYTKIKTALAGSGIDVVRIGDEVLFQSNTDFTVARGNDTSTGGLGNVAANNNYNATDKLQTSDPTADALVALSAITTAVGLLGAVQGRVGTGQNKLYYAIQLAQSQVASFSAAESRLRDADIAAEAANLTKAQVMEQASLAAMAQANASPQAVLALLRG
jgi:flagellin-like hook-associated protein FlgL